METKGIMADIREHLIQGMTSREVIDIGYAPGSVYKARRQVASAGDLPVKPKPTKDETPPAVSLEDQPDDDDSWNLHGESPFEELESLRSQLDKAEEKIARLEGQTTEAQTLRLKVMELEQRVESMTRSLTAQEKQNAIWEHRCGQVEPVLAALCTAIHSCSAAVEPGLPEYAGVRYIEAMATVRKHSQYKGETAELDDELIASLNRRYPR